MISGQAKVKPCIIPLKSRLYNVKFANTDVDASLGDIALNVHVTPQG